MVDEASGWSCVRVIHSSVKGRARLEVDGLYRCEPVRRKVESELLSDPRIIRVSANILTGRVLILFNPECMVDEIAGLIEAMMCRSVPVSGLQPSDESRYPACSFTAGATTDEGRIPRNRNVQWQALPGSAVLEALETSKSSGLTQAAARLRLQSFGPNSLVPTPPRSSLSIFFGQFKSLPVLLLGISALLSGVTGGVWDAVVILAVVLINAGIGYITESGAERTINEIGKDAEQNAVVIREGKLRQLGAEALVPGDIIILVPGTHVAADARLLESRSLMADESSLTGESMPVAKIVEPLETSQVALADRANMVYMGTAITGGSGAAVVVATGRHTEMGTIQALVSETSPPETPMQRQLRILGNQMVLLSGTICGMVFLIGLARGYGWLQMLKTSISLAVAAVPEGLPAVATTTLALGIRNMRKRGVLVRHLEAVETLGAMQVICLDKTGTLTRNQMSVLEVQAGGRRITFANGAFYYRDVRIDPRQREELLRLIQVAVLCNEAEVNGAEGNYEFKGSGTENALMHLALAAGVQVDALRREYPRVQVEYRTERQKYMRTMHLKGEEGGLTAVKGNPSEVLEICSMWIKDGRIQPLTETDRTAILVENDRMAGEALRVLGFGYTETEISQQADRPQPKDLIWLGLAGMADPLRQGMKELMALFHRAGIDTVMITGDQSATACAIAVQLGLSNHRELNILDSARLDQTNPEVLAGLAQKIDVFSRVSPADKLQIIQALQRSGKVAAMTGDGINDGPALKAADIGVALGRTGTAVARSVADVVLEDDDLHTMIVAVGDGRAIYDNIRKSVHFLTATNLSEIMVMLSSIGAGLGTPLSTMQLLWINLVTDVFPALALAVEPPEPDILSRPPRDPREPIVMRSDFKRYGFESLAITAGSMASYGYATARYGSGPRARTLAFMTLTMAQLLHGYSCRSDRSGIFSRETLPSNRYLNLAVGGTAALQLASLAVPGLRRLLGITPPGVTDAVVIGAGAALPFIVNEATKKRPRSRVAPDFPALPSCQEVG